MNELNFILNLLHRWSLTIFLVIAFIALSVVIDKMVPWQYLVEFFRFVRKLGSVFSFTWDMSTTYLLIGLSLSLFSSYWVFRVVKAIIKLI